MRNLLLILVTLSFFACGNDNMTEQAEQIADKATESTVEKPIAEVNNELQKEVAETKEALKEEAKVVQSEAKEVTDRAEKPTAAEKEKKEEEEIKKEKPKKKKKRAKISFKQKTFDFGDIRDGDIVKHDFKFKNIGDAPLNIKNVTATCGCTQPSFPFMPIAPGEEGVINVTFDSTGKINEQRPTVTVTTNGRPSIVKLNLTGMVRPKL